MSNPLAKKTLAIILLAAFLGGLATCSGGGLHGLIPGGFGSGLLALLELTSSNRPSLAAQMGEELFQPATGDPTLWSGPQVPAQVPTMPGTEITGRTTGTRHLTTNEISVLAASVPPGTTVDGTTCFAAGPGNPPPGQFLFTVMTTNGSIPLSDDTRHYQYASVFDQDDDPLNNFVPVPAFPDDFFKGTDLWFQLLKTPGVPWALSATDARNNNIQAIPSDARCYVRDDTMMFMIPMQEFSSKLTPGYRVTTFCHGGDFGQNPPHDWSGDDSPSRNAPLATISDEGRTLGLTRVQLDVTILGTNNSFLSGLGLTLGQQDAFVDSLPDGRLAEIGNAGVVALSDDWAGGPSGGSSIFDPAPTNETVSSMFLPAGAPPVEPFGIFMGSPLSHPQGFKMENFNLITNNTVNPNAVFLPPPTIPAMPFTLLSTSLTAADLTAISNGLASDPGSIRLDAPPVVIFDGQHAFIQLQNEPSNVADLTSGFTNAINGFNPLANQAFVGPTLDFAMHVVPGTPTINLDLRFGTHVAQVQSSTGFNVGTTQGDALIPFVEEGRARGTITMTDGQTIILGGILEPGNPLPTEGIPFLHDVPVLNHLFQSQARLNTGHDIVIMITPTILEVTN